MAITISDPVARYTITLFAGLVVFALTGSQIGEIFGGPRSHGVGNVFNVWLVLVFIIGLPVSGIPFALFRLLAAAWELHGACWSMVVGILTSTTAWILVSLLFEGIQYAFYPIYRIVSWIIPGATSGFLYWYLGGMRDARRHVTL